MPNPASIISVGNPIGGGAYIEFPNCQRPNGASFVLLYTRPAFATSVPGPTVRIADRHSTPRNPKFECPVITFCDDAHTAWCIAGGEAFINSGTCNVAVRPATWSQVRGLYNH